MARTLINTQIANSDGIIPSYTAAQAAPSHQFYNDGDTFLHVKNGSGSTVTVTFITPGTLDGNAIADKAVTIAAGVERMFGNLAPNVYNQPDSSVDAGQCYIDIAPVTSVTLAVFKA